VRSFAPRLGEAYRTRRSCHVPGSLAWSCAQRANASRVRAVAERRQASALRQARAASEADGLRRLRKLVCGGAEVGSHVYRRSASLFLCCGGELDSTSSAHSREGGNPAGDAKSWVPAFAGTSGSACPAARKQNSDASVRRENDLLLSEHNIFARKDSLSHIGRWFGLSDQHGRGVSCDETGVFVGGCRWSSRRNLIRNKQLGTDAYRGRGKTFQQCVLGMVTERCGGSPTA
jgi:hypothetical protein